MPNLKVLSLANNLIEKIERLDTLVNLVELNLSFNKIEKIENLNVSIPLTLCVFLTLLTLFSFKMC